MLSYQSIDTELLYGPPARLRTHPGTQIIVFEQSNQTACDCLDALLYEETGYLVDNSLTDAPYIGSNNW